MTNGATPEERLSHLETDVEAINKAVKVAREEEVAKKDEINRRLNEMNEVREQISKERASLVTTDKHEGDYKTLDQKINGLQRLVYIGIGIVLTIEVALRVVVG